MVPIPKRNACVSYGIHQCSESVCFPRKQGISISGALYHCRDDMRYLFFNIGILAGLPDGGGMSGEVGAGVGGIVMAAVGSPKTFRSGKVVTMLE